MRSFVKKILLTILVVAAGAILMATQGWLPLVSQSFQEAWDANTDRPAAQPAASTDPAKVSELLDGVEVAEHAQVDYDRDAQFASSWGDPDGNGCDARNDILVRDLENTAVDDDGCTVLAGDLDDPFTGDLIEFERGQGTSQLVHIDHVVPIAWAARGGALEWTDEQRYEFYNDPANLIAVDGPANSAKGDAGPGDWLPPNEDFHCDYVSIWVDVVTTWDLTMPPADAQATAQVLQEC